VLSAREPVSSVDAKRLTAKTPKTDFAVRLVVVVIRVISGLDSDDCKIGMRLLHQHGHRMNSL
jgi:hypothetical protein